MTKAIKILRAILFVFTIQAFQAISLNTFILLNTFISLNTLIKLLVFTLFQSDPAPSENDNEIVAMRKTCIQSTLKKNPPSTFREEKFFLMFNSLPLVDLKKYNSHSI